MEDAAWVKIRILEIPSGFSEKEMQKSKRFEPAEGMGSGIPIKYARSRITQ